VTQSRPALGPQPHPATGLCPGPRPGRPQPQRVQPLAPPTGRHRQSLSARRPARRRGWRQAQPPGRVPARVQPPALLGHPPRRAGPRPGRLQAPRRQGRLRARPRAAERARRPGRPPARPLQGTTWQPGTARAQRGCWLDLPAEPPGSRQQAPRCWALRRRSGAHSGGSRRRRRLQVLQQPGLLPTFPAPPRCPPARRLRMRHCWLGRPQGCLAARPPAQRQDCRRVLPQAQQQGCPAAKLLPWRQSCSAARLPALRQGC